MGNKNTKRCAERDVSATILWPIRILSENEAWEIALRWQSHLQGFVTLTTQWPSQGEEAAFTIFHKTYTEFTIVECLEWIEFDFEKAELYDLKPLVRAAHDATIAWFALSCCPGFGGNENPLFWKRVFSMYTGAVHEDRMDETVQKQFFNHPDHPFPRVQFHGFTKSIPLKWWEKLDRRQLQPQKNELRDVLKQLEPMILRSRWNRIIPVSIRVLNNNFNPMESAQSFLNHFNAMHHDAPRFEFTQVLYRTYDDSYHPLSDTQIRHCASIIVSNDDANRIQLAMESLFAQQQGKLHLIPHVSIQNLDLWWISTSEAGDIDRMKTMNAAWCSTLPHTWDIACARAVSHREPGRLDFPKAAWLGYAIFHPDTAIYNSSIESLTLRMTSTFALAAHYLLSMASSNNLLVGHGMMAAPAPYTKARVRPGSAVFNEINGREIYTFPSECWITLCQITPSQSYLGEWACIVLPGHGIAWVLADSILEFQELAPAPSCIRRLRLILGGYDMELSDQTKTLLCDVLSVLGERLTYLHIESYGFLEIITVHSILRLCPNLTSLRIHHDGSCWTEPHVATTPEYPRLQELELTIPNTLAALNGPHLTDLHVFRVLSPHSGMFPANRSIVQTILQRYPRIQYVNWHVNFVPGYIATNKTFDKCVKHSLDLLDPDATGAYEFVHFEISLDARLAFLSVVRRSRSISALGQFSREIVEQIFDFSANIVPRVVDICDTDVDD